MSENPQNNDDKNVIDIDVEKLKNRTSKLVPLVIIVVIAFILITGSVYTVDTKEDAVVLRLGQYHHTEENAGLHFKMPLVDVVTLVDVKKVYNMEYGFRTGQTGTTSSGPEYSDVKEEANVIVDGANNNASIALIELIIQYQVEDPVEYLYKVDDVEGTLRLALEDVIRNKVQAFTLDQAKTQKEIINEEVLPALQKKIETYNTGLRIKNVSTQNVNFLPSVEEAYQQKENANQYKNGKVEDGEKYENTVVPQAEAEAATIVQEANGYAATVKSAAKAEVAQFLALYEEYSKNEEILREKYYLDAMREFLSNNEIIVDFTDNGNFLKMFNANTQGIN